VAGSPLWHALRGRAGPRLLAGLGLAVPLVPLVAVGLMALRPSSAWDHLAATLLGDYVAYTAFLVVAGSALAALVGTGTAWLVSTVAFPGRAALGWALALPLAIPPYIAAYAWADLTGVRGAGMALFVFTATLYPYVYLAARAAFSARSVCALEAAGSLGAGPWRRFVAVALPMARPAILGGAALVGLEIAADYGASAYLGVPTLSVGVFRTWFSMGDLAGAARLAVCALGVALLLVWIEGASRRGAVAGGSNRWRVALSVRPAVPVQLAALAACALPVLVGLVVPVGHLAGLALEDGLPGRSLWEPVLATFVLALAGAGLTLMVALAVLAGARGRSQGGSQTLARMAALAGYATPGAVLALGVLAVIALAGGQEGAAALAGPAGLVALTVAYAARFLGAAYEPLEAGLQRATRSLRDAAAALGAGPWRRFLQVELPVAMPALLAAALIVMVEVAKELPATLILRPFGFDTLAVRAHAYATDERLAAAAWPALLIVLVALVPVVLLTARFERARVGAGAPQGLAAQSGPPATREAAA
jgi:iron(III) transport system permease protein